MIADGREELRQSSRKISVAISWSSQNQDFQSYESAEKRRNQYQPIYEESVIRPLFAEFQSARFA